MKLLGRSSENAGPDPVEFYQISQYLRTVFLLHKNLSMYDVVGFDLGVTVSILLTKMD